MDGASSTAQNFKVPKMLIGLTIVAFGTSAPEFAVSMSALTNGNTDMVLGNAIGSNILNILLILGIAAVIKPIKVKDETVKKELPLTLLISTLLVVVFLDIKLANQLSNQITRSDGIVLLLFFSIFISHLVTLALQKRDKVEKSKFKIGQSIFLVIVGLMAIIAGSNMVVNSASSIAKLLGLSERVISLSIIAFGTSLPELVTTIVSSKKGEQDLLVGNIIGSNIFNICIVLGVPVSIYGSITPINFNVIDLIMLILSALIIYIFSCTKKTVSKTEGVIMLFLFIIYYTLVFVV